MKGNIKHSISAGTLVFNMRRTIDLISYVDN